MKAGKLYMPGVWLTFSINILITGTIQFQLTAS